MIKVLGLSRKLRDSIDFLLTYKFLFVWFNIPRILMFLILGTTGSGKSILCKLIAQYYRLYIFSVFSIKI